MNKIKIYQGLLKSRADVVDILGPMLPAKAQVLFAYGAITWQPIAESDKPDGFINILVMWEIDRKFFQVVGQSLLRFNPLRQQHDKYPFQLHDSRLHNPGLMLRAIDTVARDNAWDPLYTAAFKGVLEHMEKLEQSWNEDVEQFGERSQPAKELPGAIMPPLSEN